MGPGSVSRGEKVQAGRGLGSISPRVTEGHLVLLPRVSLSQLLCGGRDGAPNSPGSWGGMHMAVGLPASLQDTYCTGVIGP